MNDAILEASNRYLAVAKAIGVDSVGVKAFCDSEADIQSKLKSVVRSNFSMIEAILNASRELALEWARYHDEEPEILAKLEEKRYVKTGEEGILKAVNARWPLKDRVKFVLPMLGNYHGKEIEVDYSCAGGAAFLRAIKARDRITHPKSAQDFELSKEDVIDTRDALLWYVDLSNDAASRRK